ncbi:YraN family protein [Blastopirellula sp. J2-11]|uniref:YraN family protein n=1 Tax=Blastopirellula sp. J2-11 TaxID=2943192 RepID=UPI0021C942B0|nr:YraN family protein [Blastopirellula sp. J2-11]UUO05516.1 YraN family protein [Blastopirellula sp. J2-11]
MLFRWIARWRKPQSLGARGEAAAVRFLRQLGYTIIACSDRSKLGEIDIIAVDRRTVVFVEVKTRSSSDTAHPSEAVDAHKQAKLTRLAISYLRRHNLLECKARFDVIAITWPEAAQTPTIEHFLNAFEPTGSYQMFS